MVDLLLPYFAFHIFNRRNTLWLKLRSINTYNVTFLFVGIFFQQTAFIINFRRCLNVTRKADWTFLNNLATFGGFLFSYFHRFTIGIGAGVGGCLAPGAPPRHVIIMGPFASQVAVTSLRGHRRLLTLTAGWNIAITTRTVFMVDSGSYPCPKTQHIFGLSKK